MLLWVEGGGGDSFALKIATSGWMTLAILLGSMKNGNGEFFYNIIFSYYIFIQYFYPSRKFIPETVS